MVSISVLYFGDPKANL